MSFLLSAVVDGKRVYLLQARHVAGGAYRPYWTEHRNRATRYSDGSALFVIRQLSQFALETEAA